MTEDFKHQPPTDRATILDKAKQARSIPNEGQRRFTVKALCRDRFRSGPMYDGPATDLSDDEIIEAAYGAGGARTYWRAWLLGASGRPELMQAIAAHCAVDQDSFHRIWRTLLSWLDRAPAGLDLTADARWLADNPNTRCFIPSSLLEILENRGTAELPESPPETLPAPLPVIREKRRPGRPSAIHLVRAEWLARQKRGETLGVKADEARALLSWLSDEHPKARAPNLSTIQNHLSDSFATLKVQVKGS